MSVMDSAVETTTPPAATEEPARRGRLVPALVASLVVAVSIAGVFGALWLTNVDTSPQDVGDYLEDRRPEVTRRVNEIATLLLNYDATNIEEVGERLLSLSTGDFRQDYEQIVAGELQAALEEASSSSRGQILEGPDVYFRSASEAVAILRLSQTTQSSETPGGQSFDYVMRLTLVDTSDGGWKADDAEILSEQRT